MSIDARLKRLEALLRAKAQASVAADHVEYVSAYLVARDQVFGPSVMAERNPELRAWREYLADPEACAPPAVAQQLLAFASPAELRGVEAVVERLEGDF